VPKFEPMEFTAKIIADFLNGKVEGNPDEKVSNVSPIESGKKGTLAFLANPKYAKYIYTTEASVVLVSKDFIAEQEAKTTLVRVDDAYKAFAALLDLYQSNLPQKTGIDSKASISKTAVVGENCYIGDFAYIGDNAKIGNNVKIYPQVYIGDNVTIDDNTKIFPGVKIYFDCRVGKNCIIHAGTVIGSDGFGFAPTGESFKKIPQIGNVVIEDEVEIGSNCSIDRATMGSTLIRKGVKLDNLIQVAHNCEIGDNTVMAAQVGIAGSTKLGKNCMIGGQVGFAGHISICDNVKVGAQAGVGINVKEEGMALWGSPAFEYKKATRSITVFKNLPELAARVNQLEREIKELQNKK
jgi:UDP-3-O-[3-hydroxymyristoyl] glucosamine N-acyltransferase